MQPEKAKSPMVLTLDPIDTRVRLVQFRNDLNPMLVTPSGIVISRKLAQLLNAQWLMWGTPLPIVTLAKPEQEEKAPIPRCRTLSGMTTAVRLLQWAKATSPMEATFLPSVRLVRLEQL